MPILAQDGIAMSLSARGPGSRRARASVRTVRADARPTQRPRHRLGYDSGHPPHRCSAAFPDPCIGTPSVFMATRPKTSTAAGQTLHSLLSQANRQATSRLRRLVGGEGLPVEFWRVLEVLADERGRAMSELAAQAGMQLPATSKLVDRMTDAALIQRSADPADQRRVILHISDFGLQKVAALSEGVKAHRARIERSLSPDREAQLRELLGEFIRANR